MARAAKVKAVAVPTIGSLIDSMSKIDAQLTELNAQVADLKSERSTYETELIKAMDSQGIERSAGKTKSAKINTTTLFTVEAEAWADVVTYAVKQKMTHMLRRQVNSTVCEEQLQLGRPLPGITTTPQRKVGLYKLG